MNRTILFLCTLLGVANAGATTAVVNYDTVYSKWSEAVSVSTQLKTQLDDVNTKLSTKTDTRALLIKQANEYAAAKPANDAELKTLTAKLDTVRKQLDDLDKEIQALQASPELRKQINDQQAALRVKVGEAVSAQAQESKVDLVLDASALNSYGLPLVVGKTADITDSVIARLEAAKAAPKASK